MRRLILTAAAAALLPAASPAADPPVTAWQAHETRLDAVERGQAELRAEVEAIKRRFSEPVPVQMPGPAVAGTMTAPAGFTFADRTAAGFGPVRVRSDVRPGTLVRLSRPDGTVVAIVTAGDEFFAPAAPDPRPAARMFAVPRTAFPPRLLFAPTCGPNGCPQ